MADFFLGTQLVNSAAPTIGASALEQKMGRDHHFSLGMQQQVAPFTVARGELRRQHRPLPERHDATSTSPSPPPAASRRGGRSDLRQHHLLRRLARDDLPLAAGLGRAAHARRPVLPGVVHVVEEPEHAERARRSAATPAARRRSPASTCRTTSRSAPATSCRSAASRRFLPNAHAVVDGDPRRLAGPGHLRLAQRPAVHARRSRAIAPTPASAASGPNRLGSGAARQPDGRGVVRQDGVRAAGAVHLRRLGRQHPARGQLQDARLLAVQAVPDRHAPPAVPRRGVQPDQHAELQRARTPPSTRRPAGASRARRARRGRCSSP